MSLFQTGLLNGIAVAIKVASALVINKVLATTVGPNGYALIGQVLNIINVASNSAGGIISNGVINLTAKNSEKPIECLKVLKTSIQVTLISSILSLIIIFIAAPTLSITLLDTSEYTWIIMLIGFTLPIVGIGTILTSFITGKMLTGIYINAYIISTIISTIVICAMALNLGLWGALLAIVFTPMIALPVTLLLIRNSKIKIYKKFWGPISCIHLQEIKGFALMGITSAIAYPTSQIIIRTQAIETIGATSTGCWQAVTKMSELYLLLITSVLSIYFLPRISKKINSFEIMKEIISTYKVLIPASITLAVIIFMIRTELITVLFSKDFSDMEQMYPWQLIGDIGKVASWVLSYTFIGRSMTKIYTINEIAFAVFSVLLSVLFMSQFGLKGLSMAYAISYISNFFFASLILRKKLINQ